MLPNSINQLESDNPPELSIVIVNSPAYMREEDLRLQAVDPVPYKFGSGGRKRHHNCWNTPLVRKKLNSFTMKKVIDLEQILEELLCVPLVGWSILTHTCRNGWVGEEKTTLIQVFWENKDDCPRDSQQKENCAIHN